DDLVTGVQTCALPICGGHRGADGGVLLMRDRSRYRVAAVGGVAMASPDAEGLAVAAQHDRERQGRGRIISPVDGDGVIREGFGKIGRASCRGRGEGGG